MQQFQPLRRNLHDHVGDAHHVAAQSIETGDEAELETAGAGIAAAGSTVSWLPLPESSVYPLGGAFAISREPSPDGVRPARAARVSAAEFAMLVVQRRR